MHYIKTAKGYMSNCLTGFLCGKIRKFGKKYFEGITRDGL